jgi:hypothetical protein
MPCARNFEMFMEINGKAWSPENIATVMAPENRQSAHLQRMEDSCSGCPALSMTSGRTGRGYCEKKMFKKCVQSRNVYENKQISDKMLGKKSDIYVLDSDICVKSARILRKKADW